MIKWCLLSTWDAQYHTVSDSHAPGTPGQLGEPQESGPGSAVFICTLLLNSHNNGMHLHGTRHEHLLPCTTRFLPASIGKILTVATVVKPFLIMLCAGMVSNLCEQPPCSPCCNSDWIKSYGPATNLKQE